MNAAGPNLSGSEGKSPHATEANQLQPIDLPSAFQLANVQNPEVALARERIKQAMARQNLAEMAWLPNFELGSTWIRHDGQIQRAPGEVINADRSSLFVGGGPTLTFDTSQAIYGKLAARQLTDASRANAAGVANEQLLDVALAYTDLIQAYAEMQINLEATKNAQNLLKLTEDYERAGKGAPADTARARTEVYRRERQQREIQARIGLVSARLVQLLRLPPEILLHPAEPAAVPIALVPEEMDLGHLLSQAVQYRPELAENRAIVAASLETWRASKMAPLLPNLRLAYAGGGFGGGPDGYFGDFDWRSDFAVTAVWQLQNLGFGNGAIISERQSLHAQATFRQASVEARVASQVVASFRQAFARRQELVTGQKEVASARESYRLNEERVRRAPDQGRPIELLQAIQALAQAQQDFLVVITDYNRAQFRLYTAMGHPPPCALNDTRPIQVSGPSAPLGPGSVEQAPSPQLLPPVELLPK